MWALITKFLLWIAGGGLKEVGAVIDKIGGMFRKPVAERKQENEESANDEFRAIEKGERPKWDA